MKRMKKLASLFLAMVMVLSMTVAAFAEGETPKGQGNFTITLNNKNSGHTYTAYQVFKGDLLVTGTGSTEEKKLSNIEWADNVLRVSDDGLNRVKLIDALKAVKDKDGKLIFNALTDNSSAQDVAEILANQSDDSEAMQNFVKAIRPFLGYDGTESVEGRESDGTFNETYTISGLEAGYYLVEDSAGGAQEGDAYSRYMLEVVANVQADVKATTPDVTKKILEGNNKVDANTAGIGQSVSYEIMGEVPDHQSYIYYYYVISDKLSSGLTFNDDIVVELGTGTKDENGNFVSFTKEKELVIDTDYKVYTGDKAEGNSFQIAFLDVKSLTSGKAIRVTYSAEVNSSAVIGSTGNSNEVTLKYSNDPNKSGRGDKEDKPGYPDPDKGTVTGDTPKDITITYLAQVDINKTFQGLTENLPNAEFTITGTSKQTFLTGKTYYEEDANGEYYMLKKDIQDEEDQNKKESERYTKTAPVEPVIENGVITNKYTSDQYVRNEDGTYKKFSQKRTTVVTEVNTPVSITGTTNGEGKLVFEGLGEGTYWIEETKVPAGFNKAPNVTVVIEAKKPQTVVTGTEKAEWSVGSGSSEKVTLTTEKKADGTDVNYSAAYQVGIENRSGSILPSTGGIGRTIFYAAGIILMAGAMFFVVRRKRA